MLRKLGAVQLEKEQIALKREKDQAAVWALIRANMERTGQVPNPFLLPTIPNVNREGDDLESDKPPQYWV